MKIVIVLQLQTIVKEEYLTIQNESTFVVLDLMDEQFVTLNIRIIFI